MSEWSDRARRYHERIRAILLHDWDPIGVAQIAEAQDEYDSYVSEIHGMLIRREPRQKLIDHLWWIESSAMGLCGNRPRTDWVVDELIRLREEIESNSTSR